jgi:acyl-CoA thioesterase
MRAETFLSRLETKTILRPMSDLPAVLRVEELGEGRWSAPHPDTDPEGRDVVFSGQLLAQMILAAHGADGSGKQVKSIHAIFARAGKYSAGTIELALDPMHAGRAWASTTVTATQDDRLLSRGLVLLNAVEPDLIRHSPPMPDVPGPDDCAPGPGGVIFPGAEVRFVDDGRAGAPTVTAWVRAGQSFESVAANQAVVAWSQPGMIIGAAFKPHAGTVDLRDAHRSISTGVISHTTHFHDDADAGDWLLMVHEGSYAGRGRVFGQGAVFTRDGTLVSTFAQDSMARGVDGELDFKTSM